MAPCLRPFLGLEARAHLTISLASQKSPALSPCAVPFSGFWDPRLALFAALTAPSLTWAQSAPGLQVGGR